MFLKLESWKKVSIFKGASMFEDCQLKELGSLIVLGIVLSRPSGVKNFQPLTNEENSSIYRVLWWTL